jgi:regulator of protease activity HflC (stomatin/prohibitin superfamily)
VPVETNERGLDMQDGVTITKVVGAGRYGPDMGFYAEMPVIDCGIKSLEWTPEQDELVTKDKQPIGITISVSYARDCEAEKLVKMYSEYRPEATAQLVLKRLPRVAKESTPEFTLDQALGIAEGESSGRGVITRFVGELLTAELAEFYVMLVDVGINNIDPSDSYLALLQQKADAQVAVEVAVEQTKLAQQELLREEKQTLVEVELARRDNLINEELAQVFESSPEYMELERLRLLADVIGPTDKLYFVPEGTDITLFLGTSGSDAVPVTGN